jgi:hypothetical protein
LVITSLGTDGLVESISHFHDVTCLRRHAENRTINAIPVDIVGVVLNSGTPPLRVEVEDCGEGKGYCVHQWRGNIGERDDWTADLAGVEDFFAGRGWQIEWQEI